MQAKILLIGLCLGLGLPLPCFSQHLSRDYVAEQIRFCHPEALLDSANLYILDGKLFQESAFYTAGEVQSTPIDTIFSIDYLGPEAHRLPHRPHSGIVIITTIRQQKKKAIKKEIAVVKSLFEQPDATTKHPSEDSRIPGLVLDGEVIFPADAHKFLTSLRPGKLMAIRHSPCAYPVEQGGQNAKNGVVQIWTKRGIGK